MTYLIGKYALTAFLVVAISEIAKRSTLLGAVLASIPLVSVLAIIWIYLETKDTARIAAFSTDIIWLVISSLILFIILPLLLKQGVGFWYSLGIGCVLTVAAYLVSIRLFMLAKG